MVAGETKAANKNARSQHEKRMNKLQHFPKNKSNHSDVTIKAIFIWNIIAQVEFVSTSIKLKL